MRDILEHRDLVDYESRVFNPVLTSRLAHPHNLDESIQVYCSLDRKVLEQTL